VKNAAMKNTPLFWDFRCRPIPAIYPQFPISAAMLAKAGFLGALQTKRIRAGASIGLRLTARHARLIGNGSPAKTTVVKAQTSKTRHNTFCLLRIILEFLG
jgi:hypothetical protein